MGKLAFKLFAMLAIMLGVSNYMMYIMTGKLPFSADSFSVPSLPDSLPSTIGSSILSKKQQAYKWTDENGVVHYSSEAPSDAAQATIIEVDPNTNMVQGLRSAAEPDTEATEPKQEPHASLPQGNIYNPDTIKKLIDDAKNVQETLNKRNEDIDKY